MAEITSMSEKPEMLDTASSLLDIYCLYLQSICQGGQPCFPVLTVETVEKILALREQGEGPLAAAVAEEKFSSVKRNTLEEVCRFVQSHRVWFPVEASGIVVGLQDDAYLLESALFALLQGRAWVALASWDDLVRAEEVKNASSILIFGTPQTLTQSAIAQITLLLSNEEQESRRITMPFGFMTALSLDSLLYLMYKNLYYPRHLCQETLFLNALALNRKQYTDENVDLITRDECDLEKLQEPLAKHRDLTIFSGHGHEDCLFLGKVSIFPSRLQEEKDDDPTRPLSAYMRSAVDEDVIYTDQFKTRYLFVNTCCGIHIANGLFPGEFTVGLSFLEGAVAAYISTFMVKDNSEHEPLLFSRLAQEEGMRIGEAVRIVNNLLFQNTNDFPCYLLIGDPEEQFGSARAQTVKGQAFWENDEQLEVLAKTDGGYLVTISLAELPHYEKLQVRSYCLEEICFNGMATKDDLNYLCHEDTLRIYSTKRMAAGDIMVRLRQMEAGRLAASLFAIDQYPQRLEFLQAMRLFDQKYKGLAEEINNSIKTIGSLYKPATYSLRQAEKYRKLINRLAHNLQRLQESLIAGYLAKVDKGSWAFTEVYSDDFLPVSRRFLNQSCRFCGNPLLQKNIIHPAYRSLTRDLIICPRCSIISDAPSANFELSLSGSESIRQGETLTKKVIVKNTSQDVQLITCGLGVERTRLAVYPFPVRDALRTQCVQPGETIELTFAIGIHENCVAHSFYLKAFLLVNFEVACLHNVLFVLPHGCEKRDGTNEQ